MSAKGRKLRFIVPRKIGDVAIVQALDEGVVKAALSVVLTDALP